MAIKRITISVPDRLASRIKKAAGTRPVSAWVTEVVEDRLDDEQLEREWQAFVDDVAPSNAAARKADALYRRLTKPQRKKGAA